MNKLKHLPVLLIFSYLIRLLITGAGIGDSIVMLVLGALYAGHVYLDHIKEPEANAELRNRLIALEESHATVKNKVNSMSLGATLKK